jgi:hypothetical protein
LTGTWDINSYNHGGDEMMGLIVESASVTFEAPTGNSGIFSQVTTFVGDEPSTLTGRYVLDETAMQVTLYYEGEVIIVDIAFTDATHLLWESTLNNYPLVIKATKRP